MVSLVGLPRARHTLAYVCDIDDACGFRCVLVVCACVCVCMFVAMVLRIRSGAVRWAYPSSRPK